MAQARLALVTDKTMGELRKRVPSKRPRFKGGNTMNEKQSLSQRKDTEKASLVRLDGDLIRCETRMLREERYSLKWHQILADLNAMKLERQRLISKIVEIRMEIDKVYQLSAGDL